MAQQRLSVRKIAEILRLRFEQRLTPRAIAGAANCALSTVQECLRRAETAGVGWPLPPEWDEAALRTRLYPKPVATGDYRLPDFGTVHTELARKGVTRWLLWQEYKSRYPEGLQYTVFCNHYRRGLATQDAVLRPVHAPGEKRFVDYAGQTVGESRVRHHFLSERKYMQPLYTGKLSTEGCRIMTAISDYMVAQLGREHLTYNGLPKCSKSLSGA